MCDGLGCVRHRHISVNLCHATWSWFQLHTMFCDFKWTQSMYFLEFANTENCSYVFDHESSIYLVPKQCREVRSYDSLCIRFVLYIISIQHTLLITHINHVQLCFDTSSFRKHSLQNQYHVIYKRRKERWVYRMDEAVHIKITRGILWHPAPDWSR